MRKILKLMDHEEEFVDGQDISMKEVSIKDIAEKLRQMTEFEGEIKWDPSRPDGPKRRVLNAERACKYFGFQPTISIDEGLSETVKYWKRICEDERI